MTLLKPQKKQEKIVYQNQYSHVYAQEVDFGSFKKKYFVTNFGEKAGIVVIRGTSVLLVRQYRHLIDRVSWEIPGGKVDLAEGLEEAARRECMEETGILCRVLKPLLMFHPGLDTLYNSTHLFHTRDFEEKTEVDGLHGNEVCGCDWVPLDKCIAMILSREIADSLSVIALLSYHTFIKQE